MNVHELLESGKSEVQIAEELGITLMDVYTQLAEAPPMNVTVHKTKPNDKTLPVDLDTSLKALVEKASKTSIQKLQTMLDGGIYDADELAKITNAIAKLHTTHFKEDTTNITIQQNSLSMFRESLKN